MGPTLGELIETYARAVDEGNFDAAREAVDLAIAIAPGSAEAWGCRGEFFRFHARKPRLALECFERAATLDPASHLGPGSSAVIYEDIQQPEQALEAWAEAIRRSPGHPDLWRFRARLLDEQGDFEAALDDLDECLRLAPAEVDAHSLRGEILLRVQRFEEALAAFERGLRVARGNPRALTGRSFALSALGRVDEANASRPEGDHDPGALHELRWNGLPAAPNRRPLVLRYRVREEDSPRAMHAQAHEWLRAIGHAVPGEQILLYCGWRLEVVDTGDLWILAELDLDRGPWRPPVHRFEATQALRAETAAAILLDDLEIQGVEVELHESARMCPTALANVDELRMRREEPAGSGDSGWRIGPVDSGDFERATRPERYEVWPPLEFILETRLDLLPFLTLPVGFELVFREGELVSIRDPGGTERLAA